MATRRFGAGPTRLYLHRARPHHLETRSPSVSVGEQPTGRVRGWGRASQLHKTSIEWSGRGQHGHRVYPSVPSFVEGIARCKRPEQKIAGTVWAVPALAWLVTSPLLADASAAGGVDGLHLGWRQGCVKDRNIIQQTGEGPVADHGLPDREPRGAVVRDGGGRSPF